jgi:hypothetical protein
MICPIENGCKLKSDLLDVEVEHTMERPKVVAIITGAIALLLGVAYLILVQLLDFRGEMLPAPDTLSVLYLYTAVLNM